MALPSRHGELARAQFSELIPLSAEEGKAPASDAASVLRKLGKAARNAVLLSRRDYRLMVDRKSTRLNSSHIPLSRMPSSA